MVTATKNKTEEDFLSSLPNSENDFLSGIPDATPTGLPKLSASATPTIDAAQDHPTADPQLIMDSLQAGNSMPAPAPTGPPPPAGTPTGPIDKTQLALDSADSALTSGGMALGGTAGTAAAIALAPESFGLSLLLPVIGAALGYGSGKSASNLLQRAISKKAPLNDLPEALTETVQDVKAGAMMEMGGGIVNKAIIGPASKVLAPLAEKVGSVAGKTMDAIIEKAAQYKMNLTPAEITQSKGLQLLENFLSNMPFSAGRIQKFRADQLATLVKQRESLIESNGGEKALEEVGLRIKNLVDDSVKDYNHFTEENLARLKDRVLQKVGSPETYHDLIQPLEAINSKNIARLKQVKNTLYKNAADLMPDDLTAVPENFVSEAKALTEELTGANEAIQDKATIATLKGLADTTDPVNVTQLLSNRKALNALIDKETNFITGETSSAGRVYQRLVGGIDKDLDAMAQSTGNETIIDAQRIANAANANYKNYVQDPLVKKIAASKKPDAIVASVYSPGNDTEIKKFQKFYGQEFAERAKKVFTDGFLHLTPDPSIPDAPLTGDFIRKQMQRYGSTMNTIYSPAEVGYFRRVADVLDGRASLADEVIKNPVMKSVLNSGRVSGIIDLIVKPRDVGNVAIIKKYVGENGMKEIQNGLLNKLLLKNQIGNFAPQTFAKTFDSYEPRVLQEVLPKDVYLDLKKLSEVTMRTGGAEKMAGNPSGTARNVLTGLGIGFMVHNPVTTGTIILGSRAFTELYLSKLGREWLTKGFQVPAISNEAVRVAARITGLMLEHQKNKMDNQGDKK